MKRFLYTLLLMAFVMQGVIAQTTIVCNAEGELPKLLEEQAGNKTNLVISGIVSSEDIRAIKFNMSIS